jgi:hypothetical protein
VTIRKATREPRELGTLSLYSMLDELGDSGMTIDDARRTQAFLKTVEEGLTASLASSSRLHGWRVQTMFAAVALAIGDIRLLSVEDEGDYYFDDDDGPVKAPDFRVVTATGEHLLVEVKNVAPAEMTTHSMSGAELEGARRYADWTGARLMMAHYWAGLNLWTLIDSNALTVTGRAATLTVEAALPVSELGLLGDQWLATTPPLVLSLIADKSRPRAVESGPNEQTAHFTIGAVELSCAGRRIDDPLEQEIAARLMFFGSWQAEQQLHYDEGGKVDRLEYVFMPTERAPAPQKFEMVGTLSSMYSALYNLSTLAEEGRVRALRREPEPGALAELVPHDYWNRRDRALPLWRFDLKPRET